MISAGVGIKAQGTVTNPPKDKEPKKEPKKTK